MLVIDKISNNLSNRIVNTKDIALYCENTTLLISKAFAYKEYTGLKSSPANKSVPESSICKLEPEAAEFSSF
jgi:hypothetical protein